MKFEIVPIRSFKTSKSDCYWHLRLVGHEAAMGFYLEALVLEALYHLVVQWSQNRSTNLDDVARTLREGRRNELGNSSLEI